jgi:hypothetical protein
MVTLSVKKFVIFHCTMRYAMNYGYQIHLLPSMVALVVDVYYDIPTSMSKCLLTF